MELRNLGRSGLRVSAIGLGCNNFGVRVDLEQAKLVIHKAIDLGITLFDTADIYGNRGGSENDMGKILGENRQKIVLASKCGMAMSDDGTKQGGARRYIMKAVEDSLRRLRTDWLDLYQLHVSDPLTPIEETLRAFDDLITQGKVRYIGCSNLKPWEVVEAQWTSKSLGINHFTSCQDEYSLLNRKAEAELLPAMRKYGLGLLPYYPLAGGLLSGKYRRDQALPEGARLTKAPELGKRWLTERNYAVAEKLIAFAEARGHTVIELAFSWLLAQPPVSSVIAGATRPEQVAQNVTLGEWKLSPEELAEIDKITA